MFRKMLKNKHSPTPEITFSCFNAIILNNIIIPVCLKLPTGSYYVISVAKKEVKFSSASFSFPASQFLCDSIFSEFLQSVKKYVLRI